MFRTSVALLLLSAAPVLAGPATPEGAASIEAGFRAYLGSMPGIVSVQPDGDVYRLTLSAPDFPLPPDASFSMSPMHFTLTELGGTRWKVESGEPWSLKLDVPGKITMDIAIAEQGGSGIYDTALAAFESYSGSARGMHTEYSLTQPGQPPQDVTYDIESMTFEGSAKAGMGGGVDGTSRYAVTGLSETLMVPMMPGGAPVPFKVDMTGYDVAGTLTGMRTREIMDLLAWFVARPDQAAIRQDEDGMKAAISAALPLWNSIEATGTAREITVTTPFGSGGIESAEMGVKMNGAVTDGRFGERVSLKGLTLPVQLIPEWAHPLLPKDLDIDFTVSGFDPGAAARLALSQLSFTAPPPADFDAKMQEAILPDGTVTLALGATGLTGADYDLHLTGDMNVGPGLMPVGKGSLVLQGVDAILGALGQAPEQIRGQAVPGILMARGISRAEGDKLIWDIEATEDGKVLVNGGDMSGLMKQ